jgi:hypothetical protein
MCKQTTDPPVSIQEGMNPGKTVMRRDDSQQGNSLVVRRSVQIDELLHHVRQAGTSRCHVFPDFNVVNSPVSGIDHSFLASWPPYDLHRSWKLRVEVAVKPFDEDEVVWIRAFFHACTRPVFSLDMRHPKKHQLILRLAGIS